MKARTESPIRYDPPEVRGRLADAAFALAGGLCVALLAFVPAFAGWLGRIDRQLGDELLRLPGGPAERADFVFFGIDDSSLALDLDADLIEGNPALERMSGRFPWDRRVYAEAIDRLAGAGARLVILDLVLAEPSDAVADAELAAAIARHPGRVVLASMFSPAAGDDLAFSHIEPYAAFIGDWDAPVPHGFVNFRPDPRDGVIRDVHFTSTLSQENDIPAFPGEPSFDSLAAAAIRALGAVPPDGAREPRIATARGREAGDFYQPHPVRALFMDDDWRHRYDEGRWFRDKVVMIGPSAARFQDIHQTPAGLLTGPQLHLQAMAGALDGAFVTRPWQRGARDTAVLASIGALMAAMVSLASRRPVAGWFGAMGLVTMAAATCFWLSRVGDVLLPFSPWSMAFVAGVTSGQSRSLLRARAERGRLHREFRRFVSRDVADMLVENPALYQHAAGGRRRRVAVLFSDIRGFTSRSEHEQPEALVAQLNGYFSEMVDAVFRHGGTLDKFIGDAVMAHWGALVDGDDATHASAAIGCARDMLARLERLNTRWLATGGEPLAIGIGLHLGTVVAGEIGSPEKTEFGVIGDAVNVASRVEGLTKVLRCPLLVTADIAAAAADPSLREIARVRVKGRDSATSLWTAATPGDSDEWRKITSAFHDGRFAETAALATAWLADHPDDGPAAWLRRQAVALAAAPPPAWDGVLSMTAK